MIGHYDGSGDAPPLLVGREDEYAVARASLDGAFAGRGSLVLVSGEAGIGKTALATNLSREAAARGATVLTGHCYDHTETPPYGLWSDLFAHYRAAHGSPPPPPAFTERDGIGAVASQAALFTQVFDFLREATAAPDGARPILLVLDDVHWADPASLDLLRVIARSCGTLPLLILVLARAEELTRAQPLYAALPLIIRESNVARLSLRHLAEADIAAYVTSCYALPAPDSATLARALHARSEGNPFFMRELLRMLEDDGTLRRAGDGWAIGDVSGAHVPLLLRQVTDARLAPLGDETRRRLEAAAVIGETVSFDLWARICDITPDTLIECAERAIAARILDETADGNGVRFVHILFREALYEGVTVLQRRALHARIGRALAALPHSDPDIVAAHLTRANDPQAARWLIRAGVRAQHVSAYLTAAERYRAALALRTEQGADACERGWLLDRLAWMHRYADPHRGLALLAEASDLADACDDAALAATIRCQRGELSCYTGDYRRGIALLRDGITALERRAPHAAPSLFGDADEDFRGRLAARLAYAGSYHEAETIARAILRDMPRNHGETPTRLRLLADANHALGRVHAAMGRPADASRAFTEACTCFDALGDQYMVAATLTTQVDWAIRPYRHDWREAVIAPRAAAAAAWERASAMHGNQFPYLWDLTALALGGRWHEARNLVRRARTIPPADGSGDRLAGAFGELLYRYGDAAEARRVIAEALPDGPATAPGGSWFAAGQVLQRTAAQIAMDAGDFAKARAWLEAHDRWLAWSGGILGKPEGNLAWAAYFRAIGAPDRALDRAARALADTAEPPQPRSRVAAHQLLGQLSLEAGDAATAERHLDAALALGHSASPPDHAATLLTRAELHVALRQWDAARALRDASVAAATALGDTALAARAAALAIPAEAAMMAPPAPPARLTEREVAALRLLAAGRSNREIGAALGISTRTAERHVAHIYMKIDANGRVEATAYALRHGLIDA